MKFDYSRKGKVITETETGKKQVFDSINKAKKESTRLQASGKTLQVIK